MWFSMVERALEEILTRGVADGLVRWACVLRLARTVAGVKVVHKLRMCRTKKEISYGVMRRVNRMVTNGHRQNTDQEDLEPCHGVLLLYRSTVRTLLAED